MTSQREQNRDAMPAVAEMVDQVREHFPNLRVLYAHDETTGVTVGIPPEELEAAQKRGPRIITRVRCRGCVHRVPDPINPPHGLGHCEVLPVYRFPGELHHCPSHEEAGP